MKQRLSCFGIMCAVLCLCAFSVPSCYAEKKIKWRYSTQAPDSTIIGEIAKEISAEISKRTNGGFIIQVFTGGVLGTDKECAESIRAGAIECGQGGIAKMANYAPLCNATQLPYLFKDWDEIDKALSSDAMHILAQKVNEAGFYSLGFYSSGFRHVTNNVRPIFKLDDFKGIKIRVQANTVYTDTFKALGAYPVGMAAAEITTSLQQGTIDAQENPYEIIYKEGFHEFCKYLSKTGHIVSFSGYYANPKAVAALPGKYRTVLVDVFKKYSIEITQRYRDQASLYEQKLIDSGIKFNKVSPENLAAFKKVCQEKVWTKYSDKYGEFLKFCNF